MSLANVLKGLSAIMVLLIVTSCMLREEVELAKLEVIPEDGVRIPVDLPYYGVTWRIQLEMDGECADLEAGVTMELINESNAVLLATRHGETLFTQIQQGQKTIIWAGSMNDLKILSPSIPVFFYLPQRRGERLKAVLIIRPDRTIRFSSGGGMTVWAVCTDGL